MDSSSDSENDSHIKDTTTNAVPTGAIATNAMETDTMATGMVPMATNAVGTETMATGANAVDMDTDGGISSSHNNFEPIS
jgi:hypothetical protein